MDFGGSLFLCQACVSWLFVGGTLGVHQKTKYNTGHFACATWCHRLLSCAWGLFKWCRSECAYQMWQCCTHSLYGQCPDGWVGL